MIEQVWELDIIEGGIFRNTDDGLEFMDLDDAQRRLNATERLSAEDADLIADTLARGPGISPLRDRLLYEVRSYANILKEK